MAELYVMNHEWGKIYDLWYHVREETVAEGDIAL